MKRNALQGSFLEEQGAKYLMVDHQALVEAEGLTRVLDVGKTTLLEMVL